MSVRIMSMVFDHYEGDCGQVLLAVKLADHGDDNGENIYPSVAYLALKTRQSERTVQRQLAGMVESGWLLVVTPGGRGRRSSTEYRINPEWIEQHSPLVENPVKGDKLTPLDPRKGDKPSTETPLRVTQLCHPNLNLRESKNSSSRESTHPAPPDAHHAPPAAAVDPLGGGKTETVIQAMVAELEAGRAIGNPAAFAAKVCGDKKHIDTTTGVWLRSLAQFRIDDAADVRREQREAAERRFAEAERRSREAGERELERLSARR